MRGPDSAPAPSVSGPTYTVPLYGAEFSAGALVGSYVVEELCHRGNFTVLYRARHAQTRRLTAVKVMRQQLTESSKLLRRFQQEVLALQQLRHQNIVEILEAGELRDGRPYLAVEWLEGRDLAAQLQQRGPMSVRETLAVLEQVGSALQAAHDVGIVHRDLKAQNIMVLDQALELIVKVVDFGIAKWLSPTDASSGLTSTGMMLGTPASMAPEQIRGGTVDARTDVYALGVLLYQLVTGQLPFRGATSLEVEEMHLHSPAPRPGELVSVPARFDEVVGRCLQKTPADRYPDVSSLLDDLRGALQAGAKASGTSVRPALALYVEILGLGNEGANEEAQLEVVDDMLESCREVCEQEDLDLVLEAGNAVLAATPLPVDSADERRVRERLIRAALSLGSRLRSRAAPLKLQVALTLNVALAEIDGTPENRVRIKGGPLFAVSQWASGAESGAVVSLEAIAELESQFTVQTLPGSNFVRVES